jgi:hypothetical protein
MGEVVIAIVVLIACLLNVILFFKIWGMTNDIRSMTNNMIDLLAYTKNIQKNVVTICKEVERKVDGEGETEDFDGEPQEKLPDN